MELLFIWIEDYGNIKRRGFNFSPKFNFIFEPEYKIENFEGGKLSLEEKNTTLQDTFFGSNIRNITGIIGENGSGKSSLIEAILTTGHAFEVLRGQDDGNLIIHIYHKKGSFVPNIDSSNIKLNISIRETFKNKSKDLKVIFYSNLFDGRRYKIFDNKPYNYDIRAINLSTDYLIQCLSHKNKDQGNKNQKNGFDFYYKYHIDTIKRQIWFISKFLKYKNIIKFSLPSKISLKFELELDINDLTILIDNFSKKNSIILKDKIIIYSLISYFIRMRNIDRNPWNGFLSDLCKILEGDNYNYNSNTFSDEILKLFKNNHTQDITSSIVGILDGCNSKCR
jgi:AAA15 family ATPase/GTPase